MIQTIDAVYDGTALRLAGPLPLAPETRVRLTVEVLPAEDAAGPGGPGAPEAPPAEPVSFLDTLLRLKVDGGPPDWSQNIDMYLYGSDLHPPR